MMVEMLCISFKLKRGAFFPSLLIVHR